MGMTLWVPSMETSHRVVPVDAMASISDTNDGESEQCRTYLLEYKTSNIIFLGLF